LDNNLVKGFIRPSTLNIASLILLVKKLGGSIRICINYRGINNIFLKNEYLLLLIKEMLNTMYKAK
ncbi:hypothetical protein NEUTE2DRAFT_70270, partial [Neurospora tetrasperma FGSC 2509]